MADLVAALQARLLASPISTDVMRREFHARPPASLEQIAASEAVLGFALPPLLRRIYLEVANGGFGPGYGVLGVEGGFVDYADQTAVGWHQALDGRGVDGEEAWPPALAFCSWGCLVYSVVEARPPYAVSYVDFSGDDETLVEPVFIAHKPTLELWFEDWLAGRDLWREVG